MALFYFDHYDGEMRLDSDGTELGTLDDARIAAATSLSEMAKRELTGTRRELAIEVSDTDHKPLFRVSLIYEMINAPDQN